MPFAPLFFTSSKSYVNRQDALKDPLWKLMQCHEDIPYRVFDMNQRIYQQWSRTVGSEPGSATNQRGFLHADRLLKLRNIVINEPLTNEAKLVEWGKFVTKNDLHFHQLYEESQRRKNKGQVERRHTNGLALLENWMPDSFARKPGARGIQKALELVSQKEMEDENDETPWILSIDKQLHYPSPLLASSPVRDVRVGPSASSKLNYIINEVRVLFNILSSQH